MSIYLKWFFLAIQNLVFTVRAYFASERIAKETLDNWMLPEKYRNYQTPDAYMNGMGFGGLGKGGDKDFYNDNLGKPLVEVAKEWMKRNTAHGYRAWKLGIDYGGVIKDDAAYCVYRDGRIIATVIRVSGSMSLDSHSGEGHFHYVAYDMRNEPFAFMYYRNLHFTLPLIGEKRLRLKLGWDLWPMWWPDAPRMFVCSIGIHRVKE